MSFKVYPVLQQEADCKNYTVKINGVEVDLNTARVSAVPYNRRWPGHQRTLDQTELVNFLSLACDESLHFEITPKEPFSKVDIRPLSLGINPEIKDGVISFTLEKPAYFTVEPYGRNNALHIFADEMPEYDIDFSSENVIYYGKGFHEAGTIELKSNQTLFIDEGAVVFACIKAIDAKNIKILGRGILDNSHNKAQILFKASEQGNSTAVNNAKRQHTVQLEYCTDILIDGITIRDSLVYNIRPVGCENLTIKNVKIIGCWRYNSDGIDMHNCKNVLVEHCFIRTFDDCICVKGFDCYYDGDVEEAVKKAMYRNGKVYDVFKDTVIRDCTVWNDWGKCLEIGAETKAEEICNIVFENCNVIHVTGDVLDCQNVDFAYIHDVIYRNINVEYDDVIPQLIYQNFDDKKYEELVSTNDWVPALILSEVKFHFEYSEGGTRRGKNSGMLFENIHLYSRQPLRVYFMGYSDDADVSNITMKNIYHNGKRIESLEDIKCEANEFCKNIKLI